MSKKVSGWPLISPRKLPEGLPDIEEGDAGKVLTVGEDGAEWAEASGGALPDLSSLQNDIGTAVMAAISSASTSGHMGAYSAMTGSVISDDEALAIADAINIGRFKALDLTISVSSGKLYSELSEHLQLPMGTMSFVLPDYNGHFVGISIATDESNGEPYQPIIYVAAWAIKVGNYPSS